MIDARIGDLYDDPFADRNALEGYAGETASALIQLASLVLSAEDAARSADAAGHAGVAQAIAGLILLMPLHRRRGQVCLPLAGLRATGLAAPAFLAGPARGRIFAAHEAFAGLGLEHLEKARQAAGSMSKEVFPAFLPVALVGSVLRSAVRQKAAVLDRQIQAPQWRRQLRLMRAQFRQRF